VNDQLGPELSAAARQLIADARGADEPSAEDEARVKARWLAGIAAGAGVSSLTEAVRAAASTGWGLKVGALAAALAAATAGIVLGWPQASGSGQPSGRDVSTAPVPHGRSVVQPSSAPATSAAEPAPVAAPQVPSAPAEAQPVEAVPPAPEAAVQAEPALPAPAGEAQKARPAVPPRSVTSARRAALERAEKPAAPVVEEAPAAAPGLNGRLSDEIAALSEIRGQLQKGEATRALAQLSEYRRRFAEPSLAMEADALRVDALCSAGQREAARAAAAAFPGDWPNSPLQQRVSAACP
jgi:hypothetical protein